MPRITEMLQRLQLPVLEMVLGSSKGSRHGDGPTNWDGSLFQKRLGFQKVLESNAKMVNPNTANQSGILLL